MNVTDLRLRELLDHRRRYPVGAVAANVHQYDYIADRLALDGEPKLLLLPAAMLARGGAAVRALREMILEEYSITHLAELGAIWSPSTTLPFQLLLLAEQRPERIHLARLHGLLQIEPKSRKHRNGDASNLAPVDENRLAALSAWINGNTEPNKVLTTFTIAYSEFNPERFLVQNYDPELRRLAQSARSQDHVELGELADVLLPRPHGDEKGRVLSGAHISTYPLSVEDLPCKERTSVRLQKGDLVFMRTGFAKGRLINEDPTEAVFATAHQYVVRLRDPRVTPEFLFLYLRSEAGQAFAASMAGGTAIPLLRRTDVLSFPVPLPTSATLNRAAQIFETLYRQPENNEPASIYQTLFARHEATKSPIEAEFLIEELGRIRQWKASLIRKVVENDLREIETCHKNKAYKSAVILCGSVLEAILLDWLSEVDQHDYVTSDDRLELATMIRRFSEERILGQRLIDQAHLIRRQRNLIHPKSYLQGTGLEARDCEGSISALKAILTKRFGDGVWGKS